MKKYENIPGIPLSRKELKNIKGGDGIIAPGEPTGGSDARERKCCLTDFPDICSGCVVVFSNAVCGAGATLTNC